MLSCVSEQSGYSLLSATTGSFFAALLEGISPEMRVSATLIATSITAATGGRYALRLFMPVRWCMMRFIGMQSR